MCTLSFSFLVLSWPVFSFPGSVLSPGNFWLLYWSVTNIHPWTTGPGNFHSSLPPRLPLLASLATGCGFLGCCSTSTEPLEQQDCRLSQPVFPGSTVCLQINRSALFLPHWEGSSTCTSQFVVWLLQCRTGCS